MVSLCAAGLCCGGIAPEPLGCCMDLGASRALRESLCDPGTPVVLECPFGSHLLELEMQAALHPTAAVASSSPS